ncbi:MAG: (d)CMP kinase [Bacillota bacterium]|jgi:cytidylate kinase|nr:(d)CMP kinase [Candidatus Fermentithermobacillaceae bacterium]
MKRSQPCKNQDTQTARKPGRRKRLRIAIDGPAGAGKSTVARRVADILGYIYLDTGAMYRALAVLALDRNISFDDPQALGEMASSVRIDVSEDDGVFRVWIDGEEFTHRLRTPETDRAVKLISMAQPVRRVLVEIQRELARRGGVVMEGRDITSVVIPDAEVKVFLTADVTERARRRWVELRNKGIDMSFDEVLAELQARDAKDHERGWGKLVKVEGAVLIDSTHLSIDEVCCIIIGLCEAKQRCSTS